MEKETPTRTTMKHITKKTRKKVRAWVALTHGDGVAYIGGYPALFIQKTKPRVIQTNCSCILPVVPCTITYTLPVSKTKK